MAMPASAFDFHTGVAGGEDTQVLFNDGGKVSGDSGLTFNKTTGILSITGTSSQSLYLDQNVETLSTHKTLVTTDKALQKLDPDGVDRNVVLPAEDSSTDLCFIIYNMAGDVGENLIIQDDASATLIELITGEAALLSCDGTVWIARRLANGEGSSALSIPVTEENTVAVTKGQVLVVTGGSGSKIEVGLADCDDPDKIRILGLASDDIDKNGSGHSVYKGILEKVDTRSTNTDVNPNGETWSAGDLLWVDDTAGGMTNVRPTTGRCIKAARTVKGSSNTDTLVIIAHENAVWITGASGEDVVLRVGDDSGSNKVSFRDYSNNEVGSIDSDGTAIFDTIPVNESLHFFIASSMDTPSVTVTQSAGTISLNIEKEGTGDIDVLFSDGLYVFDCTDPVASVTLTAGTDVAPQINYVYLLKSNKTLTNSTSGFPSAEHFPIATVLCQSAASLETYGAYKVHAWTDHNWTTGNNGHMAHINRWIRAQHATWRSGVALTPTITTQGAEEDNINIATTAGTIRRIHSFTFPVFNTAVASSVYIVNKFGANYTRITDLRDADEDSSGNAIINRKYINLVIWGVQSQLTDDCKLFLNLPSGFHATANNAVLDSDKYSNYNIPANFKGAGFLIARLTLYYETADSGTWTLVENLDLRGQFPSTFAGGTAATATEFYDSTFKILDEADPTKEIQFQASGITTETTRTFTVPDVSAYLVTDATSCTDLEGTKLSINTGTLNVTETDSVVGAVTGIVKADGGGNISAAVSNTDYLPPIGPILNNGETSCGYIDFLEDSDNGTNYVRLLGPPSTDTVTINLGSVAGTIVTDGNVCSDIEGTGLAITDSVLNVTDGLASIAGLTEAGVSILETTADNVYNVVTSGGNDYILGSNSDNTALEFKTPAGIKADLGLNYKTVWIPAGAFIPTSTNGAEAGSNEYVTNDNMVDYLAFDGTTKEYAAFNIPMDEAWDRSTIKAKFYWAPGSSEATESDTVEWQLAGQVISNDDALDVAMSDAGEVISDAVLAGVEGDLHISGATPAVTVGGTPALGDMTHFKVSRNVDGTDDMTEDAWLLGVLIQYQITNVIAAW
jgi:hypothetical protein